MKNQLLTAFLVIFSVCIFPAFTNAQTITVGSSGATYSTLKAAFDAINAGTVTGTITIQVVANTTETASAVLNASGSGSASYSSVNIYPTLTGLTISGNLASPLVDLNGADNITIDGRVNASGSTKDLVISNASTSNTAGTSTLRFINDAVSNTIRYCTAKGSVASSASGIIFFSTSGAGTGNDNNTIDNNNITNAGSRGINAIYSLGTAGQDNSGNTISNNSIYDFFHQGIASNAISMSTGNTGCTISGNSFYDTGGWNPGNTGFNVININNASGNNFTVSGNYIGGTAPSCGGGAFTKGGSGRDGINCIYLNVGSSVASNVQGNTIANWNYTNNSNTRDFTGIQIDGGSVNVGTITGNTIGASSGTGSITGYNVSNFYGVRVSGSGPVAIENNSIGSVTLNTASSSGSNFQCITVSISGALTIRNNTVGSTSTANSINAISASTAASQSVYGIVNGSSGIVLMSANTIANLSNNASGGGSLIAGLYNAAGAATSAVTGNFIRSLTLTNAASSAAALYGISIAGGTATYSNNIVSVGDNAAATIYGIADAAGANNIYFNTVYIGGSPTTGSVPSYALFSNGGNTRNYRNNILVNARSNNGASGNNYAIALTSAPGAIDYNDYYAPGTNGLLGVYNAVDKTTLADWKLASVQDCNSYNESPSFASAGGTLSGDYLPGDISLKAVDGTGVSTDFTNAGRSSSKPAMGAFEYAITPGANSLYISSFAPASGAVGASVTITGTNFTGATGASFNGVAVTSYTVNSAGSITATVPAGATTGKISVGLSCGSFAGVSDFTVLASLPVSWLSFTAGQKQDAVLLEWSTATEQGAKDFLVEYSSDGSQWYTLGTVAAAGIGNSVTTYSYIHHTPLNGNNYYRLQQRDLDGQKSYSKVVSLLFKGSSPLLHIYGNPVTNGQVLIQLNKAAVVSIFNPGGQLLFRRSFEAGLQKIQVEGYAKGLYLLKAGAGLQRFIIE